MKVWVEDAGTFFYPDVTLVCGERKFYKNRKDTIENPILVGRSFVEKHGRI